jgi:hypothetical protein
MRITPVEGSYMRDWRLTWRPVCDSKAVTEKRKAKTKLPGEQDIGHRLLLLRSLVEQIQYTHSHLGLSDSACRLAAGFDEHLTQSLGQPSSIIVLLFHYLHFKLAGRKRDKFALEKGRLARGPKPDRTHVASMA